MPRPPVGTRGGSGGKTGRGAGGGGGCTREASKGAASKYRGVSLKKSTGRWRAECRIGGKKTFLGNFHSEEDAARAWDRFKLWRCKADGKTKEEVEEELNFPLSEYSDAEVTALQRCTQEELIQELRQKAEQARSEAAGVGPASL